MPVPYSVMVEATEKWMEERAHCEYCAEYTPCPNCDKCGWCKEMAEMIWPEYCRDSGCDMFRASRAAAAELADYLNQVAEEYDPRHPERRP